MGAPLLPILVEVSSKFGLQTPVAQHQSSHKMAPKGRQNSRGFSSHEDSALSYNSGKLPKARPVQFCAAMPRFNPMNIEELKAMKKELADKDGRVSTKKDSREEAKIRSDIRDQASPQARLKMDNRVRFSSHIPTTHPPIELSLVDQKWGRLFDKRGPTKRLGQFLRGLANHMLSLAK